MTDDASNATPPSRGTSSGGDWVRTIVVGTDGSPSATAAARHAIDLARGFDAALHIVCAVKPTAAFVMPEAAGMIPAVAEVEGLAREHARLTLDQVTAEASQAGVAAEVHQWTGDPAAALCEVATNVRADLIVVGNRGMSGARRVLGSVPNTVSHHAPCSVLIVKTT